MWLKVGAFVGLAGIPSGRQLPLAHLMSVIFEWLTLLVALWLPVEWYLEKQHILVPPASIITDWIVGGIFVAELLVLSSLVRRRIYYVCSNWMNLVIIVGLFPLFWQNSHLIGSLRVLRVFMALFIAAPWIGTGHRFLERNRIWMTIVVFLVVVLIGGLFITTFNSGISNPLEGIWYALVTVTTVGYGDIVPSTWAGKVFAAILLFFGYLIFSLLTAHISSYFIGRRNQEERRKNREAIIDEIRASEQRVEALHRHQLVQAVAAVHLDGRHLPGVEHGVTVDEPG